MTQTLDSLLTKIMMKTVPIRDSSIDHPCRNKCSGWQQGFDCGFDTAVDVLNVKKLIAALRVAEEALEKTCKNVARHHMTDVLLTYEHHVKRSNEARRRIREILECEK